MTEDEKIIYANALDEIERYSERMKKMVKNALEHKVIDTTNRNPMFVGLSNDFVAASLRWALMDIKQWVGNEEDIIKISNAMKNNFLSQQNEDRFINEVLKSTKQ